MDPAVIPHQASGVVVEALDDELLLCQAGGTSAVCLNLTAHLIWRMCDGRRSSRDIARILSEAYPDAAAAIAADVPALVEQLRALGVITYE